jgi:DNA invertase Pin-like site-specific DNA recombinase
MAAVQDVDLLDVIVDAGESAKSLKRTGMQRLLADVDAGTVDVVIVAKLDRLTRSVRDLADLLDRFERRGVALVSVTESLDTGTAAGRLVLNIMASVSQWEREAIGERTREAMRHLKREGRRVGTLPYGFALAPDNVTLVENPMERQTLARMRELEAQGRPLRGIAAKINAEGHRTRTGRPWHLSGVHKLLRKADRDRAAA